jgi:hypothetical protein
LFRRPAVDFVFPNQEENTMKALLPILAAFTLAGSLAASDDDCPQPPAAHTGSSPSAKTKKGSPFYCNRLALTPQLRKRHFEELGPKLRSLRKSVRELKNGYEFEFPGDSATYQLLTEWAIQEPEGGPLWLRLSGREGTKEFIKVDGASWVAQ